MVIIALVVWIGCCVLGAGILVSHGCNRIALAIYDNGDLAELRRQRCV